MLVLSITSKTLERITLGKYELHIHNIVLLNTTKRNIKVDSLKILIQIQTQTRHAHTRIRQKHNRPTDQPLINLMILKSTIH